MITATSRHNERHEFDLLAFVRLTPFLERLSLLRDTFVLGDDYFTPAHGGNIRVIDKGASLSGEDLLIIVCASFKNNRRLRVTSRCRIFWDVLFIHDPRRYVCATTFLDRIASSSFMTLMTLWGISSRNHCNRLAAQERERFALNEMLIARVISTDNCTCNIARYYEKSRHCCSRSVFSQFRSNVGLVWESNVFANRFASARKKRNKIN